MTETLPTWIKKGAIVHYALTDMVAEVQRIADTGLIVLRGPRSNGEVFAPLRTIQPATIEQRIDFALDAQRIDYIKSILPHGKEENRFRIQFLGHISPAAIDRINGIVPDVFLDAELDGDAYIVTVKPSWLADVVLLDPVTPALLAQAQAEAEALLSQVAPDAVNPALAARILDKLKFADCNVAAAVVTKGEGRFDYVVTFPSTESGYSAAQLKRRTGFNFVGVNQNIVTVTVPAFWEKAAPAVQAPGTDMLDVLVEHAELTAEVEDADLAETARVIKELRARAEAAEELADLRQAEIDSLVAHIEGAALQAEAVAEAAETSTSVVPLTGCKQVMTKRAINDADLQKYLNEGWDILHIQFGTDDILNVVFTRDQVAPAPTPSNRAAAKLIESSNPLVTFSVPAEVYAESRQPVPSVNQATTAPRNYASIAQDRVRLNTLLNDPDVTQYNFTLAVEKSNLSREERNTLISQFRTHRTGEVLAEAPRRSAHNPFKSLGEGVRS